MRKQIFSRLIGCGLSSAAVLAVAASVAHAANTVTSATTPTVSTTSTSVKTTSRTAASRTTAAVTSKREVRRTSAHRTSVPTEPVRPHSTELHLSGLFAVSGHQVTVAGRAVHMVAQVAPYVANQHVTVTVAVNGRVTRRFETLLKHGPGDRYGWLAADVSAPRAGRVAVTVTHRGSDRMVGWSSHAYYISTADSASYGAHGYFVQLMQLRMRGLHLYIHETGVFDQQTAWALDAYHRLVGRGTARTFDATIVNDLLDGRGVFHVRFPHQGRHAEGDLTDQLLALVDGDKVDWIYPISSGKESTPTVIGSWRIYIRDPGYLSDGMYYSDFFYSGYAVHGYDPAPDYPASHGCMRLWINDAIPVFDWLAMGDWVDTYGNAPFYLGKGDL